VPIVQKLREAIIATAQTPAVQEKLKELGYVLVAPERRSTEYLRKFVQSEVEKWAGVIKAANIKPE
jgi:tripartite-type tricarboxylate transporter receptor subunit TctC